MLARVHNDKLSVITYLSIHKVTSIVLNHLFEFSHVEGNLFLHQRSLLSGFALWNGVIEPSTNLCK